MPLNIQIKALIVSFVYGIILAYIIQKQYKYFFCSKLWYRLPLTVFFVFDIMIIFFLILRLITEGRFHIYFLFMIIVGYIFGIRLLDDN